MKTAEVPSMKVKPFFELTREMLECVRDHNFIRLSEICDDDFGIIDINTTGGSEIIRDRQGWENWFTSLFIKLSAMGYSVVHFDQLFMASDQRLRFNAIATNIWKKPVGKWKEARYHSSLLGVKPLDGI